MRLRLTLACAVALALTAATSALAAPAATAAQEARAAVTAPAKTCYRGYVLANFSWGQRCIRAGQYCKKVRNPEYHKYKFQCVNGELRKQTGKGKTK